MSRLLVGLGTTFVAHAQLVAALFATRRQHLAPSGGRHAIPETMFVATLAVAWLKCTLHRILIFYGTQS